MNQRRLLKNVLALVLALLAPSIAMAADLAVPIPLQAALIRKILHYDRSLPPGATKALKVVIVYTDNSGAVGELRDGLQKLGVTVVPAAVADLAASVSGAHAIYVMPGAALPAVKDISTRQKLLTISGVPDLAEKGQVAVALGKSADDRPQILVNLTRLEAEKHEFPADFLSLTRVLR